MQRIVMTYDTDSVYLKHAKQNYVNYKIVISTFSYYRPFFIPFHSHRDIKTGSYNHIIFLILYYI